MLGLREVGWEWDWGLMVVVLVFVLGDKDDVFPLLMLLLLRRWMLEGVGVIARLFAVVKLAAAERTENDEEDEDVALGGLDGETEREDDADDESVVADVNGVVVLLVLFFTGIPDIVLVLETRIEGGREPFVFVGSGKRVGDGEREGVFLLSMANLYDG